MEETFQQLVQKAEKAFTNADHLTYVTYPLVKEDKLMITIVQNLHTALTQGAKALVVYEKKETSFEMLIPKYKISKELSTTLKEVRDIMKKHEESAVEFSRKKNYIICDDNYRMKKLDLTTLKKYILETRAFIQFLRRLPC